MSKDEIRSKINELKNEMKEVKGTPCSVYSRVVGYLRPVQSFNDGKSEEFRHRIVYNVGDGEEEKIKSNKLHIENMNKYPTVQAIRKCC